MGNTEWADTLAAIIAYVSFETRALVSDSA
jgi:hypothetical protein